ncbi:MULTISPECIES: enoyl-CoA hydratase/isomerase family protein [Salinibaculum]|uniref:enoyl-CoA hydratase/isomerase family protein n=1 Tax=Salinibaculum TaxID=2732368 RepID=UPI0030D28037
MIQTAVDDDLRTVTMDRPQRRNALTPDGLDALETALAEATEPVVYLTGAGGAFSAGADLDVVADLDADEAEAFARHGQRVARALADYDGAVVAGVDGPARGGGVELALACDIRLATPRATFAETGVSLGLFGAWGGTARLPRVVGEGEAMDVALSGRTVDADAALRMGLVSRIVDDPRSVADTIADNDAATLRTIKRLLRADGDRETRERREAAAFAERIADFDPDDRNR